MFYGEIKKCDIANGEGVRVSAFYPDVRITVRDVSMRPPGTSVMEKNLRKKRKGDLKGSGTGIYQRAFPAGRGAL